MKPDPDGASPPLRRPADDATGLPGLPTWRLVYLLVLVVFVAYVVLLVTLSKVFG
jgi:hypothetical protein